MCIVTEGCLVFDGMDGVDTGTVQFATEIGRIRTNYGEVGSAAKSVSEFDRC